MNEVDLSPIALFLAAGPVGKSVMLLLLAASVWCWVTIIGSAWSLWSLRLQVSQIVKGGKNALLESLTDVGRKAAAIALKGETVGERHRRVAQGMLAASSQMISNREGRVTDLALLSNIAPFIGLFGTVWGIMNSFTAIAEANDTSLSTVAPGVAEALAATAFGLAVAIPASMGYNWLGSGYSKTAGLLRIQIGIKATEIVAETKAK